MADDDSTLAEDGFSPFRPRSQRVTVFLPGTQFVVSDGSIPPGMPPPIFLPQPPPMPPVMLVPMQPSMNPPVQPENSSLNPLYPRPHSAPIYWMDPQSPEAQVPYMTAPQIDAFGNVPTGWIQHGHNTVQEHFHQPIKIPPPHLQESQERIPLQYAPSIEFQQQSHELIDQLTHELQEKEELILALQQHVGEIEFENGALTTQNTYLQTKISAHNKVCPIEKERREKAAEVQTLELKQKKTRPGKLVIGVDEEHVEADEARAEASSQVPSDSDVMMSQHQHVIDSIEFFH